MDNNSKIKGSNILLSLYRLIRSLTPTQKRDFKKYTQFWSKEHDQKYIHLFDHINHFITTARDVSELPSDLSDSNKFGPNASLNALAKYLFEKIMESIRNTPGTIPPRHNRLFQAFHDIHFLFYQELYVECYKVIREAKNLAYEMDRPVYLLELQIWEARITNRLGNVPWKLTEMQKELEYTLDNIRETYATFLQSQKLFVAAKKTVTEAPPDIQHIMDAIRVKQNDALDGLSPRLHYWRLVEMQYYFQLQSAIDRESEQKDSVQTSLSNAFYYMKKNLAFISGEGKILKEEEPVIYISALENYLANCLQQKDEEGIKQLESSFVEDKNKKEEIHRYRSISYYRLLSLIRFNQFNEACTYIKDQKLKENLQKRQQQISDNRMSAIRYCCVQAYFLNANFQIALEWIKLTLDKPRHQSLPIPFQISEILHIICLIEIDIKHNGATLIENLIRRYRRNEPKNKFMHDLLMALRYAAMRQQGAIVKTTIKHRSKLDTHFEKNKALYIYGPVLAWLDNRISGKSLSEEIIKYNL